MTTRRLMVVSGGSRGIGAGIVLAAVAGGYDVAFTYRARADAAHEVVEQARRIAPDARCKAYALDVRDSAAVDALGGTISDELGPAYAVVANAAVTKAGLAVSTTDEDWDDVLRTNLSGAFYLCRQFLPEMLSNRSGRLLFISSIAAHGMAGDVAYCASKAGMLGLSAAMAKEYGRKGITSNALLLSFFETELTERELSADKRDFYARHSPVGRAGQVSEVGAAVMYLASDGAAFVNGQELGVTGGLDWFH
jgi:3-oxoacyl-[acyl-carrier protein] reductase